MDTGQLSKVSKSKATTLRPRCVGTKLPNRNVKLSNYNLRDRRTLPQSAITRNRLRSKVTLSNNEPKQDVECGDMASIVHKYCLPLEESLSHLYSVKERLFVELLRLEDKFYHHEFTPDTLDSKYQTFEKCGRNIDPTCIYPGLYTEDEKLLEKDLKAFINMDDNDEGGINDAKDKLWNTVNEIHDRTLKRFGDFPDEALIDYRRKYYNTFLTDVLTVLDKIIKKTTDKVFVELDRVKEWTVRDLFRFNELLKKLPWKIIFNDDQIEFHYSSYTKLFSNFSEGFFWPNAKLDDFRQIEEERAKKWINTCHKDDYQLMDLLKCKESVDFLFHAIVLTDGSDLPGFFIKKDTNNLAYYKDKLNKGGDLQFQLYRIRCIEIATEYLYRRYMGKGDRRRDQLSFIEENSHCAVFDDPAKNV